MHPERVHDCPSLLPYAVPTGTAGRRFCSRRTKTIADLRTYLIEVPDPRALAASAIRGQPYRPQRRPPFCPVPLDHGDRRVGRRCAAEGPALLGFRPDPLTGLIRPPQSTTIRLVLAAADGDALDQAIGRLLQERQDPVSGWRAIAVDGKTLRGSRTMDRPATTLIAAMTHGGQVLAQRQADGKSTRSRPSPHSWTAST